MWSPPQVGYVKCNGDEGFLDSRSAPRLVCIYKTILDHLLFMANIDHILFSLPIVEGKSLRVFKHLNDSTNFNVSFVKRQENIVVDFYFFWLEQHYSWLVPVFYHIQQHCIEISIYFIICKI